jgi:hypothetical protein
MDRRHGEKHQVYRERQRKCTVDGFSNNLSACEGRRSFGTVFESLCLLDSSFSQLCHEGNWIDRIGKEVKASPDSVTETVRATVASTSPWIQ